jgi:hypothetical protein
MGSNPHTLQAHANILIYAQDRPCMMKSHILQKVAV